jgi:hypothetical protein
VERILPEDEPDLLDYRDQHTELGRAIETEQYRSMLTRYLDELTIIYENLMAKVLRGKHDEDLINACVSKMVSLMAHLLPKIEGGGEGAKDLLNEYKPFRAWMYNVSLPKIDPNEADKIPTLYYLIIKSYDRLGISNY